jgi:DNA replication protein DnaC
MGQESAWESLGHVAQEVVSQLRPNKSNTESSSASKRSVPWPINPPDERLCPLCKGIGALVFDVEYWDPRFSQTTPCPVCSKGRQQAWLREVCGLTEELAALTRQTVTRLPGNAAAYDEALALIENPAWFYTLHGGYGVGKTWLLAMIVNECRQRGWISIYTTTAEVMDHLRAAYAPDAQVAIDDRWERLITARVLILDEIDKFNPTPWALEKFFELCNLRYRDGAHCLTGFATNAPIGSIDGSLLSRMRDQRCQIHEVTGIDLRRIRK